MAIPCENKVYDFQPLSLSLYYGGIAGKRVLDIGCGTGNLGAELERQGNECYGVTISEQEAALARRNMKQVVVADVETVSSLPLPTQFFDVVIFADVLEHLRNPHHALELVKPHLKPNALLITSIPNVANVVVRIDLLRGRFNYQPSGLLDDTHVRFYTLKTAKTLLTSAGYAIKDLKFTVGNWRFPRPLRPFYEWEIQHRLARYWPGLFALQFVFYATPNGAVEGLKAT